MESQFWRVKYPTSVKRCAEWDHEKMELESVKCPIIEGHQHPGKRLTDLSVVLPDSEVEDFVWTWYSECLIQDRTLELLRSCRFTGFEVKPVRARFGRSAKQPPNLWEIVLTGWAGMAKPESGIRFDESKSCPVCSYFRYTGLSNPEQLIDESRWDGSDFFMVWPMPTHVFATNRVIHTVREYHLTGIQVMPVSKLEKSEGYTPGRLSYWMPENQAREFGEPLGIY
jgi:hypothetical protein